MASYLPWSNPKVLSWVILACAATNVIFLGGKRRAFGSFVAEFHKVFNETPLTELNWIGDSYSAFGYTSTSLTIAIIMYFKRPYGIFQFIGSVWVLISCLSSAYVPTPPWLFLTHTLFHGIGSSIIISVAGLVVNEYFDKKHPYHLVATTLVSGGSVASILFIYIFTDLIVFYGWRHAFIILGVIYFIVCGSAALFYRRNEDLSEKEDKKQISCQIFKNLKPIHAPLLFCWFIDRVMTSVVTYGLLLNLTTYLYRKKDANLSKSAELTMLLAAGEASTYLIGAIITALTKNLFKEKLRYIIFGTSLCMASSLILLKYFNKNKIIAEVLCFITGFSLGPSITFLFPAGEELTRLPGHIAYPISLGGMGFGMLISPFFSALVAERYGFDWFFFIQGCLIYVKCFCLFIIIVILYFYQRDMSTLEFTSHRSITDVDMEESVLDETQAILSVNKKK